MPSSPNTVCKMSTGTLKKVLDDSSSILASRTLLASLPDRGLRIKARRDAAAAELSRRQSSTGRGQAQERARLVGMTSFASTLSGRRGAGKRPALRLPSISEDELRRGSLAAAVTRRLDPSVSLHLEDRILCAPKREEELPEDEMDEYDEMDEDEAKVGGSLVEDALLDVAKMDEDEAKVGGIVVEGAPRPRMVEDDEMDEDEAKVDVVEDAPRPPVVEISHHDRVERFLGLVRNRRGRARRAMPTPSQLVEAICELLENGHKPRHDPDRLRAFNNLQAMTRRPPHWRNIMSRDSQLYLACHMYCGGELSPESVQEAFGLFLQEYPRDDSVHWRRLVVAVAVARHRMHSSLVFNGKCVKH